MIEQLRRHDLVYVDPAAWGAMLGVRPALRTIDLVCEWAEAGRPLVVRRRSACDPAGQVALGLPLPPALGKQRVAVSLAPDGILSTGRFPTLRAAQAAAPVPWRATMAALLDLAAEVGAEPLVFGSLAWSMLTRLDYLAPTSDLDLLWPMTAGVHAPALVEGLARIAAQAPVRVDGEILNGEGCGVQWRELLSGGAEVLAKGLSSVALVPSDAFLRSRVAA